MDWFFGLSGNSRNWFSDAIKVAVTSAKANTSLTPHCLYDGPHCELISWLKSNNVSVINTAVPFRDELFSPVVTQANEGSAYIPENASGHFLRILVAEHSDKSNILYTDCDVMFVNEVTPPFVDHIGVVREYNIYSQSFEQSFNSGVMIFNKNALIKDYNLLVDYFRKHHFFHRKFSSYDQTLLNEFYKDKSITHLSADFNWKPYQGRNEKASIIHFHGPKPNRISAILKGQLHTGEQQLVQFINANREAYAHYSDMFSEYLKASEKCSIGMLNQEAAANSTGL